MRLMLGVNQDHPSLLVSVDNNYNPTKFTFFVINGAWDGKYNNGNITIHDDKDPSIKYTILCDNQDRLRGEYEDVFDNYSDLNYVAPADRVIDYSDLDDDIPF